MYRINSLDFFLREWYWEGSAKINERYGLDSIKKTELDLETLKQRQFIGVTKGIPKKFSKNTIVIGGPCITDNFDSITIESINDLTNLILLAKEIKVPAFIYLSIKEEELRSGKSWSETKKVFEKIISDISKSLDYEEIQIIDTSEKRVNMLIEKYVKNIEKKVTQQELDTLYYIGNNDHRAKEAFLKLDKTKVNLHKRFLVTYLPDFLEELTQIKNPTILVVENIQQVKAVQTARRISKNKRLFHLAYLPTPNLFGKKRMYSSVAKEKVFITPKNILNLAFSKACKESKSFYFSILPKKFKENKYAGKYYKLIQEVFGSG